MRGLNITVLLLVSCSTRLKKAKTLNLAAAMCYVVVIEEKAKAFGCLFIHYCQFLALQLSSGENTIGKFGTDKQQLVHKVSLPKRNIAQKKALHWPPGRVGDLEAVLDICTQSGPSRTRQALCR